MIILAFDCNYISRRNWFAYTKKVKDPAYVDVKVWQLMVMRDIDNCISIFGPDQVVFAFDSRLSKRAEIRASYKANRRTVERTEQEIALEKIYQVWVKQFRKETLPALGYKNVFSFKGYEADDIISQIAVEKDPYDEYIIVTSDADMYQCLAFDNTIVYHPQYKTRYNKQTFKDNKGIDASEYWKVKCLAGCMTDCVRGVKGIGEKRAIQFLLGEMKKGKYFDTLQEQAEEFLKKNEKLVRLPFPGLEGAIELQFDEVNEALKQQILNYGSENPRLRKAGGFV